SGGALPAELPPARKSASSPAAPWKRARITAQRDRPARQTQQRETRPYGVPPAAKCGPSRAAPPLVRTRRRGGARPGALSRRSVAVAFSPRLARRLRGLPLRSDAGSGRTAARAVRGAPGRRPDRRSLLSVLRRRA